MAVSFHKNGVTLEFLSKDRIDAEWQTIRPFIKRLEEKATHNEFTTDDVLDLAKNGKIGLGIAYDDNGVFMVMAFEEIFYPRATAVNVLAMAGERLDEFMKLFLAPFKEYLRNHGVAWIECNVSPGMARIHGRYGFKPVYQNLRINLNEDEA